MPARPAARLGTAAAGPAAGACAGGRRAHQRERGHPGDADRRAAAGQHPEQRPQQGGQNQGADDEGQLVVGAERLDGEPLDRPGGPVDHLAGDGLDRGRQPGVGARHQLADAEGQHRGHQPSQRGRRGAPGPGAGGGPGGAGGRGRGRRVGGGHGGPYPEPPVTTDGGARALARHGRRPGRGRRPCRRWSVAVTDQRPPGQRADDAVGRQPEEPLHLLDARLGLGAEDRRRPSRRRRGTERRARPRPGRPDGP